MNPAPSAQNATATAKKSLTIRANAFAPRIKVARRGNTLTTTVRAKTVWKTTPAATNADAPATPFPTAKAAVIVKRLGLVTRAIRSTLHTPANASPARTTLLATIRVLRAASRTVRAAERMRAWMIPTAAPATVAKTAERKVPNASRATKTNSATAPTDSCPTVRATAFPLPAKRDRFATVLQRNSVAMRECNA